MLALASSMTGDHPARPALVLANTAKAGGIAKAAELEIDTAIIPHRDFEDRERFDQAVSERLTNAGIDLICLAGFMRIFTPEFATQWAGKMINIHPSLLPKYPGLNTHQRALDAGENQAGCSVHEVTPKLDDGPLLGQGRVPILPDDTAETLAARVLKMEHRLYPAVLRRFVDGNAETLHLP